MFEEDEEEEAGMRGDVEGAGAEGGVDQVPRCSTGGEEREDDEEVADEGDA